MIARPARHVTKAICPLGLQSVSAGVPPQHLQAAAIGIDACTVCQARFYGAPLLAELRCPACTGSLQNVGAWDLARVAWPWLDAGGEV